jgi:phage regulator Rha-like protein
MNKRVVAVPEIERVILHIRGQRVMLDTDLARLYGVQTKNLNKAVKRNRKRFPTDFMFRLKTAETAALRFQSGTSKGRGGRRYLPYAFTEHGVVMLANILHSSRAVAVSIEVVRVFVRLRHALAVNAELAHRLAAVEASLDEHRTATGAKLIEHERRIHVVLEAIQSLMEEAPTESAAPIGFETGAAGQGRS